MSQRVIGRLCDLALSIEHASEASIMASWERMVLPPVGWPRMKDIRLLLRRQAPVAAICSAHDIKRMLAVTDGLIERACDVCWIIQKHTSAAP